MGAHLFLDSRWLDDVAGLERAIAPCRFHARNPLPLDGRTVWKRNNLHLSWYRAPGGEFRGWAGVGVNAQNPTSQEALVRPVRSDDGLSWRTDGAPAFTHTILFDEADPDPARRYKCLYQGEAILDDQGRVLIPHTRRDELLAAHRQGRRIALGMFSACSADGIIWNEHCLIVRDTYRQWAPGIELGRNPDTDAHPSEEEWWQPGKPGWTGGDSFPCLIRVPETGKYVAFYRTNLDRRNSFNPAKRRRERGVGRSECSVFGQWGPHEPALRADTDWQDALGHGKHDFYQMQVWPCAGVWLGVVSVFYWPEDRNRLELAWSPDTFHWERVCPYADFIPHGTLGEFGGGCSYAAMRPQEVDGEVRVYFGTDKGRHNAEPNREASLMLALFGRNRFAGLKTKSADGGFLTAPLKLSGGPLILNADARGGSVRAGLEADDGAPIPGYSLTDCDVLSGDLGDLAGTALSWRGRSDVSGLAGRAVRLRLEAQRATLYALEF